MLDENGNFTQDFTDGLQDMLGDAYWNDPDTKSEPTKLFENVKDMGTLTKNYVNAQRALSTRQEKAVEGMVKVPVDGASTEDIAAFRKAVGVPESADKYELPVPEGDDAAGFKVIADIIKPVALEAGVSASALSKVWGKVTEALTAQNKEIEDKGLALMEADKEALKAELKENYDAFISNGDNALLKFKNGAKVKELLGTYGISNHPEIRRMLAEVAPLVLQAKPTDGGKGEGAKEGDSWPLGDYSEVGEEAASEEITIS